MKDSGTGHSLGPDVCNVQSSCGHTKVDERFHGFRLGRV